MTAAGPVRSPRPRGRRGQVLIIGNGIELSHGLRWPRSPKHADNIFDVLGELSSATPRDPIATIAISSEQLHRSYGDPQLAVDALRRVDPSVRIVLLESAGHATMAIDFDGFDDRLRCPLRHEDVASLFDEDVTVAAPVEEAADPEEPAKPVFVVAAPPPPPPAPPAPRAAAAEPVTNSPHALPTPIPAQLGDTDLVDAMLSSPNGVTSLALQLMMQQTGWTDVQVLPVNEKTAISSSAVSITHAGKNYGALSAPTAPPDQLHRWADWLAHWLALDDAHRTNRMLAYQDDLTGAWNRRLFNAFLRDSIVRAAKVRRPVTVMVFDLDNFKSYNDDFGHAAGDEILCETVRMMNAVVRQGDRVCRIGGDEFAVIFADPEGPRKPGSTHPDSVEVIAKRFQDQVCSMCFPKLGVEAPGTLSISAGLATYPWDGHDPDALLRHADELALESKRKGKNAITFGPGAQRECGNQQE